MLPLGRPSPAMVVACTALVVALGGTGYAATQLPTDSVGQKQLRNGAVGNLELRDRAITQGKLDLGPWEQIFYGEFDGMRRKRVLVKIIGE